MASSSTESTDISMDPQFAPVRDDDVGLPAVGVDDDDHSDSHEDEDGTAGSKRARIGNAPDSSTARKRKITDLPQMRDYMSELEDVIGKQNDEIVALKKREQSLWAKGQKWRQMHAEEHDARTSGLQLALRQYTSLNEQKQQLQDQNMEVQSELFNLQKDIKAKESTLDVLMKEKAGILQQLVELQEQISWDARYVPGDVARSFNINAQANTQESDNQEADLPSPSAQTVEELREFIATMQHTDDAASWAHVCKHLSKMCV
jgi:chromosome segregation ATPase